MNTFRAWLRREAETRVYIPRWVETFDYDPNEPRIPSGPGGGEWTTGGGGGGTQVWRAGGATRGAATFYATHPKGAEPYADPDHPVQEERINPKNTFNVKANGDHWRLYERFLNETGHPGRYGKNGHPFWTVEPELKKWLDQQGYNFDSIMFDENTGVPSIAVYGDAKGAPAPVAHQIHISPEGVRIEPATAPAKGRMTRGEQRAAASKAHAAARAAEEEAQRRSRAAPMPRAQKRALAKAAKENNATQEVEAAQAAAQKAAGPVSAIQGYDRNMPSAGKDKPVGVFMFDAPTLNADAERFQYKANADPEGVTQALKGVTKWDASKANQIIAWEDSDGKLFVVDGHQRVGLAKRLLKQGLESKIELPGILFREKDGIQASDIRAIAAAKNIAEGSGSPIDGARVLRTRPDLMDGSMPISRTEARQSFELAALNDEAFRMVVNEVVPYQQAAVVGRLIPKDADRQNAAMKALARFEPRNEIEATVLVQRVAQAELEKAEESRQTSMFGELETPESSAGEEMKIVAKAIQGLKNDTRLFSGVVKHAERIEQSGSKIERIGAQAIKNDADLFIERLSHEAYTSGPVREVLVKSARELKNGAIDLRAAVDNVLNALRGAAEKDVSDRPSDGSRGGLFGTGDRRRRGRFRAWLDRTADEMMGA